MTDRVEGTEEDLRPAKSIEVIDSQTEMYDGQWDVRIKTGKETFYITVGASDLDTACAWEAAKAGGKYTPEDHDR